jgi:hypothetical protein
MAPRAGTQLGRHGHHDDPTSRMGRVRRSELVCDVQARRRGNRRGRDGVGVESIGLGVA